MFVSGKFTPCLEVNIPPCTTLVCIVSDVMYVVRKIILPSLSNIF